MKYNIDTLNKLMIKRNIERIELVCGVDKMDFTYNKGKNFLSFIDKDKAFLGAVLNKDTVQYSYKLYDDSISFFSANESHHNGSYYDTFNKKIPIFDEFIDDAVEKLLYKERILLIDKEKEEAEFNKIKQLNAKILGNLGTKVKMIIFVDSNNDSAMCQAKDFNSYIEEDEIPTIKKVFYAITHFEARKIFDEYEGINNGLFIGLDRYLSNGEMINDSKNIA